MNYQKMKFSDAFRETMFRFGLTGVDIAEKSGLTPTQVSRFRSGANLRIDSVERIIEVLSPEAKEYMLTLVFQQPEVGHVPLPVTKSPLPPQEHEEK